MKVIHWTALDDPPERTVPDRPVSLAVGVFDGIHRGHQRLLRRAVVDAGRLDHGIPAVLTFDPNPATIINPASFPGVLSTLAERLALFREFGIEEVVIVNFSHHFAVTPGAEFLERLLRVFPHLQLMVAGFNFHLGHNRDTGPEELKTWFNARGIRVDIVPALKDNVDSISSSRIRRAVAAGDLGRATRLLGRPYRIDVVPCVDSEDYFPEQLLPPPGRYVCTVSGEDFSREGMMEISDEGILRWEPRITKTHYVIPRSKARCR